MAKKKETVSEIKITIVGMIPHDEHGELLELAALGDEFYSRHDARPLDVYSTKEGLRTSVKVKTPYLNIFAEAYMLHSTFEGETSWTAIYLDDVQHAIFCTLAKGFLAFRGKCYEIATDDDDNITVFSYDDFMQAPIEKSMSDDDEPIN